MIIFFAGTYVNWNYLNNHGDVVNSEKININYDIIGKGSLIFHWCEKEDTDWDLIGNHYYAGDNIKLIIKKR